MFTRTRVCTAGLFFASSSLEVFGVCKLQSGRTERARALDFETQTRLANRDARDKTPGYNNSVGPKVYAREMPGRRSNARGKS